MKSNNSNQQAAISRAVPQGILLNIHKVQKLKQEQEETKEDDCNFDASKRDTVDSATHHTVGVETLSDWIDDATHEKHWDDSEKHMKYEIKGTNPECDQKQESTDEVTAFLLELNTLNEKLLNRKNDLKTRIRELTKELELLKHSKSTPQAILDYINKQRGVREMIVRALTTGSTKFDPNTFHDDFPPLERNLDDNTHADELGANRRVQPYEAVFVTQKTEGYRKEKEKEEKAQRERKRDEKYNLKQGSPDMYPEYGYTPYYGKFDAPIPGYYPQEVNAYNYPSRSMYEYGEFPLNMYENCEDYLYNKDEECIPHNLVPDDKLYDQRMLYPSQNPALATADPSDLKDKIPNKFSKENGNRELITKIQGEGIPDFDDYLHNNDELFKDGQDNETNKIKKEVEEESDLFDSFSQDGDFNGKQNGMKANEIDWDLFDDSLSHENALDLDDPNFQDNSEEMNGRLQEINKPNFPNSSKGKKLTKIDNLNADYIHHSDAMNMYMDRPDLMNAQAYGHSPYMIEPLMNLPIQDERFYPHSSHHPIPLAYLNQENEIPGYMRGNPNMDSMHYYEHSKPSQQGSSKTDKTSNRCRKRNKYKMLPTEIKFKAVSMALKKGPKAAAEIYWVPLKSLKRWMKVGCVRKKGGGRKTKDPLMEKHLYSWYIQKKTKGDIVTAKMIKDKAIKLTNCKDFIASKGWLDKFKVRFGLEISKESSKDGHKRRYNVDSTRKRTASRSLYPENRESYYQDGEDQYQSFRRSINKSIKQETNDANNTYLDEETSNITVRPDNKPYETKQNLNSIKNEEGKSSKDGKSNLIKNKTEVPSIFSSTPLSNQFKTQHRIDEPINNVINLPLCDADNSGDEFTNA